MNCQKLKKMNVQDIKDRIQDELQNKEIDQLDNDLCSEDRHFRFVDGKVREGLCFWHLPVLSMDGLEISESFTSMCPTDTSPVCGFPEAARDRTDRSCYL
jgi:hypothetical protein